MSTPTRRLPSLPSWRTSISGQRKLGIPAYGSLLAVFRDRGFAVHGVEGGPRAVSICASQDLDVHAGLAGGDADAGRHAVAVAAYVLEHVGDPAAFMRDLARYARPGGAVVVVTDAIWTTQYALERSRAALLFQPRPFRSSTDHTYVFSPRHLRALFAQAGCDQVSVQPFSDLPGRESWHWRAYKGSCRAMDRWLGLGEYLVAVGRREA